MSWKQGNGGTSESYPEVIEQRQGKIQCTSMLVYWPKGIADRAFKYLEIEKFIFF